MRSTVTLVSLCHRIVYEYVLYVLYVYLYLSFFSSSSSALLLITFNPVSQQCQIYHLGSSPGQNVCQSHPAP